MIAFALAIWKFVGGNWKWLAPVIVIAGLAIDDGCHRIALSNCHALAAARDAAEAKAIQAAERRAKEKSDEQIEALRRDFANSAQDKVVFVDRINHNAPATCPPSADARDASRGLHKLVSGPGEPRPK